MAPSVSTISIGCFFYSTFLFVLCFSSKESHALTQGDKKQSLQYHTLHISSLFPASTCSSSTQGKRNGASLRVVHRHGPCSHLTLEKSKVPTVTEILAQDQSRVNSIQSLNSGQSTPQAAAVPANPGGSLGSGNYIVVVGLGTPKKQLLSLVFDTGSDLTWTQCQPCVKYCHKQQDPIFDPSLSSAYKNISCTSTQCSQLASAGIRPSCATTSCFYATGYGDGSFTQGFYATETLTLTPTDVFPNFLFGCGQNNNGLYGATAGFLGLGRSSLSVVSQTASKYGKYFSYCLPSPSSSGHLTFGDDGSSKSLMFTPLLINSQQSTFYFINLEAIKCGETLLSIPPTIFKTAGTIIDSGTVITRLPPTAYNALRTEFRKQMAEYPSIPASELFDTCYDLSNYTTPNIPIITFSFGGNIQVPLDKQQVLYGVGQSTSQVCLAFAGNKYDSQLGIFGNTQQQILDVVYDVAGGKLGFGLNGCS